MLFANRFCRFVTIAVGRIRHLAILLAVLVPTAAAAQTMTITSPTQDERITDTTPLFTGTADPNRDIELRIFTATGPLYVVPLRSDASGNWSHDFPVPLNEGPAQIEAAYAIGSGDAIVDFTVVGPPPTVQSVTLIGAPGPTAESVSYTVTFSENVTGVDATDFGIQVSGSALASLQSVSGSGAIYTVTLGGIIGQGTLELQVNNVGPGIVDIVDNPLADGFTTGDVHTVDRETPAAPVFTNPTDGAVTTDFTPDFQGTAEPGSTIRLSGSNGNYNFLTPALIANSAGNWAYTHPQPVAEGPVSATAVAIDAAGNESAEARIDFTVVGPPPTVQSVTLNGAPGPAAESVSYSVTFSEAVTGVDAPDFSVLGLNGASAFIASVSGSGAVYTVTLGGINGQGTIELEVNGVGTGIVDIVGNPLAGGFTAGDVHTVDRVAPARPVITSPSAILLANANVTFTGTTEVGSRVRVTLNGSVPTEVSVTPSGNWTYIPPTSLADGPYTFTAQAFDNAGNALTPATFSFTVDTTPPPAPAITSPDPFQVFPNPSITVAGTAEPGALVEVQIDAGAGYALVGSVSASSTGSWSLNTLAQSLSMVRARAIDAAGNASPYSDGVQIFVDSVAPAVISVTGPASASFAAGDTLDFTVNLNEAVIVVDNGSFPRLVVDIGGQTFYADYVSGSGSSALVFRLVIPSGVQDNDGLTITSLDGNGGIIVDAAVNPANLTLNGVATGPWFVDAVGPSVVLSAPPGAQTGPFTLTITFSEDIFAFTQDDLEVVNATVSGFSGSSGNYVATITPTGGEITISIAAGAAEDELGNPSAAAVPLVISTASVATEFDQYADEILAIVTDQTLRDLRARIAATERMVKAAQERLASDAPQVDRALSFQGTLQADDMTISSKGSFGAETGLANGSRRILWGEFSLTRDAEGTTSARLDTTLAWERRLSDDTLAAWYLGLEVGQADVDRSFTGPLRTMGVSLGAYGVHRLDDNLYLRGFASVTAGRNDLELSNGILSLQSDYTTRSVQAGATLSGVLPMDGWELRPALSLAVGRTWLGTLDLTGTAFGSSGEFQLDAGNLTLATLTFQPEFVVPLDGAAVADSLSLVTFAPGLTCETVSGVEDWSDCGLAFGIGLQHQSDNGLVRYSADIDLTRVGPREDTALSLSLEHRF
ncbi:MAG: Ig-like domain-containing protein [Tabrizicola sp.]|nr:Ig-like domain-containing protein [Tabrizicola sp.]